MWVWFIKKCRKHFEKFQLRVFFLLTEKREAKWKFKEMRWKLIPLLLWETSTRKHAKCIRDFLMTITICLQQQLAFVTLITAPRHLLNDFFFLHLASKTGLLVPELLPPPAHWPKNHVITWKPSLVKYSSRSARGLWKLQVMKHLIPITAIL